MEQKTVSQHSNSYACNNSNAVTSGTQEDSQSGPHADPRAGSFKTDSQDPEN